MYLKNEVSSTKMCPSMHVIVQRSITQRVQQKITNRIKNVLRFYEKYNKYTGKYKNFIIIKVFFEMVRSTIIEPSAS